VDADYAGDLDTRASHNRRFVFKVYGGSVVWGRQEADWHSKFHSGG
jgi:hypothetical protein